MARERLGLEVEVSPDARRYLAGPHAGEELERLEHMPIVGDALVVGEGVDFPASEAGGPALGCVPVSRFDFQRQGDSWMSQSASPQGSYSSALATALTPPATSTLPLGSSVAV
jgi:hypothetical protein